jgi:hypothetical protein
MLEYDHIDGWARTHTHDPDRIRLRCHAHNQHAAEQMYGRAFMERARARGKEGSPRGGTRRVIRHTSRASLSELR